MWKFILAAFLAFMTLFFFATPFVFFLDPITVGILVVIGAFIILAKGVLDPDVKKSETSNKSVEQKNVSIKTQDSKFHEEKEKIKISNSNLIENKPSKRQLVVDSNACFNYGKLTDIDGNVYNTIQIGNQVWMAENLRVSRYRNGDLIPNLTNGIEWRDSQIGAWSNFDNNPAYDADYGKLYNWYAVDDKRGLAPEGWHVPNVDEWNILIDFLGGRNNAGKKLKENSSLYWYKSDVVLNNESEFSALPGGALPIEYHDATLNKCGHWWSSFNDGSSDALVIRLYWYDNMVHPAYKSKYYGFSVRCIKDQKEIHNPISQHFLPITDTNDSYKKVRNGDYCGIENSKGEMITSYKYDDLDLFYEGLAWVKKDIKYGFINKLGFEVIPLKYYSASNFKNGLSCVMQNERYGCIDKNDKIIIPIIYSNYIDFQEGLSIAEYHNDCGFIDYFGKVIIPLEYNRVENFIDGIAIVENNKGSGYINKRNEVVVPLIYNHISDFREEIAAVRLKNKYGFVDKKGKIIIPIIYDGVYFFQNGLAVVVMNDKYGLIDYNGNIIIPIIYEHCMPINQDGLILAQLNKKWGCVNKDNKIIIPFQYDDMYDYEDGSFSADLNGNSILIDKSGQRIKNF